EPAAPTLAENRPPLVVLVVEDHPVNREVARAKLARLGYPVDLACGGGEALEAIASKDYDVVFMDLQMPGMSGLETTARLGEATAGRRVPHVIAMTASLFEEDREACRRAGMYDFVGKPIDVAQLDAVLTRVAKARGAAAPSLEQEPLTKLRRIGSLGEPRFFEGLLHIFLESTRGRLPRLTEALERGDAKDLAWEAHILKSASATLGAVQMSEVCAKVEAAARQGRLEGLGAALVTLAAQFVEVEKMLRAELEGGPPLTIQEAS
ncbi:response regulator, partial [Myxococcus sp. AM011]|uniref:response regulator n=2 Tax=Myxococcus TaxID=32 RepID=UPI001595617E